MASRAATDRSAGPTNGAFSLRSAYLAAGAQMTLLLLGHLLFTYPVGTIGMGTGSPIYQICVLATFGLAVLAARPWTDPSILLLPVTLMLTLAWFWLSISWAIAPAIALRRVVQTTVTAMTLFLILRTLGYQRVISLWRWYAVVTLVLCYVLVFAIPAIGIQQQTVLTEAGSAGTWRGAMIDKNVAGAFSAVLLLSFLFDARAINLVIRIVVVVASSFFLLKSGSKTSIGITLVAMGLAFVLTRYNAAYRALMVPLFLCVGIIVVLLWSDMSAPFRNAIYEPEAFTGRGEIWAALVRYIQDNWLFGSGYGSFWSIGTDSPIHRYSEADWVRRTVYVGHNGYLDLCATVGVPGLVLAVLAVLVFPLGRLLTIRGLAPGRVALIAGIIIFCAGNNLTESTMLNGDAFLNIVLMMALAMLYVRGSLEEATTARSTTSAPGPLPRWPAGRKSAEARRREIRNPGGA